MTYLSHLLRSEPPTMSATVTTTQSTSATTPATGTISVQAGEQYKYSRLLPAFPKDEHYPPLTPFEHVDPGQRALNLANPRAFLSNAKVTQLTPPIGEEVRGVNLATLSDSEKDQLALEVRKLNFLMRLPNSHSDRSPDGVLLCSGTNKISSIDPQSSFCSGVSQRVLEYRANP